MERAEEQKGREEEIEEASNTVLKARRTMANANAGDDGKMNEGSG